MAASAPAPVAVRLPPLASARVPRPSRAAAVSTAPRRASSKSATAAAASSPSAASPYQVFADLPDQLLCSPDNVVWVYGQYTLSFFTTEAAAQAKLERKVRAMMREAQRHYDISSAFFHSLSAEEQMVEVLRGGGGGGGALPQPPAPLRRDTTTNNTGGGGGGGDEAEVGERQRVLSTCYALRQAWPARSGGGGAADACDGGVDEDGVSAAAYSPGLRVNLVLDMVASRKTLGTAPLLSRPYRLAESLYQIIMRPAPSSSPPPSAHGTPASSSAAIASARGDMAPHVRSLVIGISDADTTLVGCHLVCPYRHLSSPTPTLMRLRRAVEAAVEQEKVCAIAAAAAVIGGVSADDLTSAAAGAAGGDMSAASPLRCVVAGQLARYRRVDALLPSPYVRVPPQSLARIDQSRLLLCAPSTLLDS